jgi:hypothetical protein
MKKLAVSLIVAVLIAVGSASAQEVADIPYFATDNEDQR